VTETKESGLLIEGMKSYPQALGALNEFVRLVISNVREAVLDELATLSTAIGAGLKEDELGDYVQPNRVGVFEPKYTVLGIKIDRIAASGWGLYFYVWWWKGQTKLCVSMWMKDRDVAASIITRFKNTSPETSVEIDDNHEVYLSRVLVPDNVPELSEILRELNREFSELWSRAGGLSQFLKP
jgi:hypothetical protein